MSRPVYNIYCDESCHLQNDQNRVMVLGSVWVAKQHNAQISEELRAIKEKHNLPKTFEAKWVKVSESKIGYYKDLITYFFSKSEIHFRGVVIPDKSILDHSAYNQEHNTWYYKMFYVLLNIVIKPGSDYNLYLDIKDTQSNHKVEELKRILNIANFSDAPIVKAQQIRSHEVELMQVVDLLIGALAYEHRGLSANRGKKILIQQIEEYIGHKLMFSSLSTEEKFNVLVWIPRK